MNLYPEDIRSKVDADLRAPHAARNRLEPTRKQPRPARPGAGMGREFAAQPDEVLKSFNSWAFKREQPDDTASLRRCVEAAMQVGRPIPFMLYWGRGERTQPSEPESLCFQFLAAMAKRIENVYAPGASITLVLTDTHAKLNGHCAASTDAYFAAVSAEARAHGFAARRLSEFMALAGEGIENSRPEIEPPAEILDALLASAQRHYRGEGTAETGARRYFHCNMREKRVIEQAFPETVFLTFNGRDMRPLFPDRMPIFFMYSIRRGVSVKPWFIATTPEAALVEPLRA